MLIEFIAEAMGSAKIEKIKDPLPYYAEIPGFKGVWAQGKTARECKRKLQEVLEEWLILKIRKNQFIPTTKEYDINELISSGI